MVGSGAHQKAHMYDLISSSTVALSTVFLIMNIASLHKAELASYDVKGAFLNAQFGPTDETTYIRITKEIAEIWCTIDPDAIPYLDRKGEIILELDKFIYGLKQSPYKFQVHLVKFLTKLGYVQQSYDECLFIKKTSKGWSIISTHVDDILQAATDTTLIAELKKALIDEFKAISFSPNAEAYIGMTIERSADLTKIKLTQKALLEKTLETFLESPNAVTADPHLDTLFKKYPIDEDNPAVDKTNLSCVMSLMYLARLTRPDIILPVTWLATKSHCCTQRDWEGAQKVMKYLNGTKDLGITLHCTSLQVHATCDASHNVHADGHGHTGYIITLGDDFSYVHSRSGKQKLSAQSSTDAEVFAMVECLKTATWIRNIINELDITPSNCIRVYQDNKSAIIMVDE
jgi:hypothetical protein